MDHIKQIFEEFDERFKLYKEDEGWEVVSCQEDVKQFLATALIKTLEEVRRYALSEHVDTFSVAGHIMDLLDAIRKESE